MEDYTMQDRCILLSGDISSFSTEKIIQKIFDINYDDSKKYSVYKEFEIEPIKLYINSLGGSVYDGLALIDLISNNETPIHTFCTGSAQSMGFWIFLAGHKRFAFRHSTFMYHEISTWIRDKIEGLKMEVAECERLQKMCDSFICERTKVTKDTLKSYKERKAEWYIGYEEAIKLNICEAVL